MALEQLQTWQDYGSNTMYIKQTAVPLFANQRYEILPDRKLVIKGVLDQSMQDTVHPIYKGKVFVGYGPMTLQSQDNP